MKAHVDLLKITNMDEKGSDNITGGRHPRDRGRGYAGLILLLIGAALLARQFGFWLPSWLYTWPMIVVMIGLFVGVKHHFRDVGWLIIVAMGGLFLMDEINPGMNIHHFVWPMFIIGVGLALLLRPRRRIRGWSGEGKYYYHYCDTREPKTGPPGKPVYQREDTIDVVSIFANVKKNILSKDFRGGETVCIFGGSEINMSQADIGSPIVIDTVNIFGGTKLIVPANWHIRSEETVAIFGGVEDKRQQLPVNDARPEKVLILKGAAIFGGIEISSY